jgi:Arc/MetJ-type ribon-helix-helix transcriptional regulator
LVKRKSFSFEESDYEWINTLILEWVEENEGKNQSDFIKQLLKDYKLKRKNIKNKIDTQTKAIHERFDDVSKKVKTSVHHIRNQSSDKFTQLSKNIKKMDAHKKIKENITQKSEMLKSGINKLYKKSHIQTKIKKRKLDSSETE